MKNSPAFEKQAQLVAERLGLVLGSYVASGAFKETYRATTSEGELVALKIINRKKINIARTNREIDALQRCDSVHIAKVLGWQSYSEHELAFIDVVIEEFLDGGTLEEKTAVQLLTPGGIAILGAGLCNAVIELHRHGLVHRDVSDKHSPVRLS